MKKSKRASAYHNPVLVSEVLKAFDLKSYAHLNKPCFVDATVGLGGHAKEFVKRGIFVIGIDSDKNSLKIAEEVLSEACPTPLDRRDNIAVSRGCFKLLHGNYSEINNLVQNVDRESVFGVLFDLGISSYQLDDLERGFSFKGLDETLDMRLDVENQKVKASDLLALLDNRKLKELFCVVLPENLAARIAHKVVRRRSEEVIATVGDFLEVIKPLIRKKGKVDSATLPFLALRMAVNSEIENLEKGLEGAYEILSVKGRLAVISFHSGEDRVVKNFFKYQESQKKGRVITKKPIQPKDAEISNNPRARSAKLRIFEKL